MAKEDKLSSAELAEQYGFAKALFYSDPSLKKLLQDAIKNDWSPDMFQAKLRNTPWYKNHSEAERKYLALQYGDPATAKQNYNDAYTRIRQMAEQLGITYDKAKDKIATAALNVASKGWSDEQVRYYLGQYVGFDTTKGYAPGGEAADTFDKLKSYAYQMGIQNSGQWYADTSRSILRGTMTEQEAMEKMKKQAAAAFPQWKTQIEAGQSMTDIAAPYMQQMSQILELPPGSVNLFDPTIKKAMTGKDKDGKPISTPLWQFENQLRQDPRWGKTQNAQDSSMQIAHKVLSDWGLAY